MYIICCKIYLPFHSVCLEAQGVCLSSWNRTLHLFIMPKQQRLVIQIGKIKPNGMFVWIATNLKNLQISTKYWLILYNICSRLSSNGYRTHWSSSSSPSWFAVVSYWRRWGDLISTVAIYWVTFQGTEGHYSWVYC